MPTTLSNGVRVPSDGDRDWYEIIEEALAILNNHTHDGDDSEQLPSSIISKATQDVLAANWVSQGEGTYKQTLTLPTNYTWNDMQVRFYINGGAQDGNEVLLSVKKVSATTFDIFINDNTLALKAVYG